MRNASQRANKRSSLTILSTRTSSTCLLNFDKITLSKFLTSVNVAQKVKKFKTLTSIKKNLGSLTWIFGKQRKFFLLKKKKVFLQRKKFLLKRKKILLQRKFSGERSQKKEGSGALLNLYANIHHFAVKSKSAFRAIFTKVNSYAPTFAISELTKKAIFARPILGLKIEMHEKCQDRISDLLYYECVLGSFFKKKTYVYAECLFWTRIEGRTRK